MLDEATDYIAVLTLATPAGADALAQMWQKRFDFGKTVNACGLKATTGEWEKIMAESHIFYTSFKLALQLADRSGAVSELRLADFREMAKGIALELQAEAILPEVPLAVAQARQLDEFCAEVDQMIGLNILPGGDRLLSGGDVAQVAEHYGLSLQADGAFHLMDERGYTLFSLSNFDNAPFRPHTMKQMPVIGLSMQLDVPRVDQPAQRFDEMALLAKEIGRELQADVVDDHRMALSDAAIAMIRAQVAALEDRMLAYPIVPGSAQARRLFS